MGWAGLERPTDTTVIDVLSLQVAVTPDRAAGTCSESVFTGRDVREFFEGSSPVHPSFKKWSWDKNKLEEKYLSQEVKSII